MSGPMTTADDDEERQRPEVLRYTLVNPQPTLLRVDVAGVPVMVRGQHDYEHLTRVNRSLAIAVLALHRIAAGDPLNALDTARNAIQKIKENV
jgi:hypothetical protein